MDQHYRDALDRNEPYRNKLLLMLNGKDRERVLDRCSFTELTRGTLLTEAGHTFDEIHFPNHGVISIVATYGDGSIIEMATIGREGCTGIGPILGCNRALAGNLVQVGGESAVMSRTDFADLLNTTPSLNSILLRYVHTHLYQVQVSGACNGAHLVEQRLARWLLMMGDRSDTDDLPLTQEFLAEMLGVQRPTVTVAARALQEAGLIRYRRGVVSIVDRAGLERASCECYRLVRDAYEDMRPPG